MSSAHEAGHRPLGRWPAVLIGGLAVGVGVAGLLAGAGVFGSATQHRVVFDNAGGRYVSREHQWFWLAAAALSIVVGLLALRTLLRTLRSPAAGSVTVPSDPQGGRTSVAASAVTAAVAEEVDSYDGVARCRVRLLQGSHRADDPTLQVRVTLEPDADVARIATRVREQAVAHARQALERPALPAQVELSPASKAPQTARVA